MKKAESKNFIQASHSSLLKARPKLYRGFSPPLHCFNRRSFRLSEARKRLIFRSNEAENAHCASFKRSESFFSISFERKFDHIIHLFPLIVNGSHKKIFYYNIASMRDFPGGEFEKHLKMQASHIIGQMKYEQELQDNLTQALIRTKRAGVKG